MIDLQLLLKEFIRHKAYGNSRRNLSLVKLLSWSSYLDVVNT